MERLPKEVVENVLRRLSVYDMVRAGCACKMLRALVSSRTFTSSRPHISLLLLLHPDAQIGAAFSRFNSPSSWAYDAERDSWLTLSLSFLQPNFPEFAYPVASDGGLVCFVFGRDLICCNPITKSWRRFPDRTQIFQQFDEDSIQAFGLKCNPTSGAYDFFCVSEWRNTFMIFSSSSLEWESMLPLVVPDACRLYSKSIVLCHSRLYTLWHRETSLMIFSFYNGSWSEVDVPECTSTLLKACLLDVSGSLYMLAGVGAVWLRNNPTSVRIWRMHAPRNLWVEVTKMPVPILHEFQKRIDFEELQCWGKNGVMFMKSLQSDILMHNLFTKEWKWLKDLDMQVESLSLIFEPSLSAMA